MGDGDKGVLGTVLGRLKYRTEKEAKAVADELSLDDTHSHTMDVDGDDEKETFFMPGGGHDRLNEELEERGREPAPARANMRNMDMMDGGDQPGTETMMGMPGDDGGDGGLFGSGDGERDRGATDGEGAFAGILGDSDGDGEMEFYSGSPDDSDSGGPY